MIVMLRREQQISQSMGASCGFIVYQHSAARTEVFVITYNTTVILGIQEIMSFQSICKSGHEIDMVLSPFPYMELSKLSLSMCKVCK